MLKRLENVALLHADAFISCMLCVIVNETE